MDRRQMIVQRVREIFGERLDDVLHVVRQDRQEMRGWQEPAHVRAAARRAVRQESVAEAAPQPATATPVTEAEYVRAAGEPEPGQQREAFGRLLETAAAGLEKIIAPSADLTPEEASGLECVLLLYGRPAILVSGGNLGAVPPLWNLLEDQREDVEMAQRGVGRIELLGHPEYDWAGTAFLVSDDVLMTTRRIAEVFLENRNASWQFRPGITAWMDYRSGYQSVANAGYRVRSVVGAHDLYDLALLQVERPQVNGSAPAPLALAAAPPAAATLPSPPRGEGDGRTPSSPAGEGRVAGDGRPVYLIGYPVRDTRRNEPETIARIFRDVYNVKRVQPGLLRGAFRFNEIQLLRHDCAPLGQTAGAPILDLETHQVVGLQTTSRYLETGTAVPLYLLRDDPLLRRAGVTFAEATAQERQVVTDQLERLARSRFWNEARAAIATLYQRAFGGTIPTATR